MNRKEIVIEEWQKNDSYDPLFELIDKAHIQNRNKNIIVNPDLKCGEDMRRNLGSQAVTFVACEKGSNTILGTLSLIPASSEYRFRGKMTIAKLKYVAVCSEARGQGICSQLMQRAEKMAFEMDADALETIVVQRNPALHLYLKLGYEPVDFLARKRLRQNSVMMIKWLKPCRIPGVLRKLYYEMRRVYVSLRYGFR